MSADSTAGKVRVRSKNDGQLGYLVEMEDGRQGVKLDRGQQNIVVPYLEKRWEIAEEAKLQAMQIARCAYEADRALRIGRGEYATTTWDSLREPARVEWARNGPPEEDSQRARLFAAITGALSK